MQISITQNKSAHETAAQRKQRREKEKGKEEAGRPRA
jgi:hypothetical protein